MPKNKTTPHPPSAPPGKTFISAQPRKTFNIKNFNPLSDEEAYKLYTKKQEKRGKKPMEENEFKGRRVDSMRVGLFRMGENTYENF